MQGFGLLLRKEVRELVRTMRLPVVLIVFAMLGLISPVFARYIREIVEAVGGAQFQGAIPDPVARDAIAQLTKNVGQFGVLVAILLSMGSVAAEKDRGTAAFLMTKPLGRGAFLGAKVASIGSLLAIATMLAGVLCWTYTAILFEPLPIAGLIAAVGLVWLSLAVFAAVTFLASVMGPSALVAGGIGLASLMIAGFLSIIPGLAQYLPTGLWGMAEELAIGSVPEALGSAVAANLAVIAAAIGLAWRSFQRQEL